MYDAVGGWRALPGFSALQRAEIAENARAGADRRRARRFSALQRAEIAEMLRPATLRQQALEFQCSSTSRNC